MGIAHSFFYPFGNGGNGNDSQTNGGNVFFFFAGRDIFLIFQNATASQSLFRPMATFHGNRLGSIKVSYSNCKDEDRELPPGRPWKVLPEFIMIAVSLIQRVLL